MINKMQEKEAVVAIVGAGMVGLALAKALGDAAIKTVVIEAKEPVLLWEANDPTARVSAINRASQAFLTRLNISSALSSAADLQRLVVWDAVGGSEITFDSAEVGESSLGAIVENREVVATLWKSLQQHEFVRLVCPAAPEDLRQQSDGVTLALSNGESINASLVVGADGAHSWVRAQMKASMKQRSYQHSAIVTVVKTEFPHQKTGWQAFLGGDVLALLPLVDDHHCAIVWSVAPAAAEALTKKTRHDFNDALNNAFGFRLGLLEMMTSPQAIPLTMRHARHYVEPRCALMGDAAHTIHPLAGQGVNLGFMDAAALASSLISARDKGQDLGGLRALRRYERSRKGDNTAMLAAMRGFKELFGNPSSFIIQARNLGLQCVDQVSFLKQNLMKIALGRH